MAIINLSPSPVLHEHTDFYLTEEELSYLQSLDMREGNGNFVSTDCYVADGIPRVKDQLQKWLDDYVDNVLCIKNNFVITNTWITKSPTGYGHNSHNHPNSIISGVYYINVSSGELVLYPRPQYSKDFFFKYEQSSFNECNSTSWTFPVQTRDLIIFPSWIEHEVGVNLGVDSRMILGFNSFVSGTLGTKETYSEVKI